MKKSNRNQPRIAIGAILFEGNSFSLRRDDISVFKNNYYFVGNDLIKHLEHGEVEISGAISVLRTSNYEIIPLIATHGLAGGRVTTPTWEILQNELISRLQEVDGIYLALHGAMLSEDTNDPEGDLLEKIRQIVGKIPIAVSCDLHGHITKKMFDHSDILVGYQLYPHDDVFETGQRAAGLLIRAIEKKVRPSSCICKIPMIVQSQRQRTKGDTPMAYLYRMARTFEASGQAWSVSYFPVQPWMNVGELGFSVVVIGDENNHSIEHIARNLAKTVWNRRSDFEVPLVSTEEAIRQGMKTEGGPILLVDASDCVGGGATGDSAIVLKKILDVAPNSSAAVLIVDKEAVQVAKLAGVGAQIKIDLGNKAYPSYGNPLGINAQVIRLFDGDFKYTGGILAGDTTSMGPSAWIRTGSIDIVVASYPTYEYQDEQFRAAGFDPNERKFIVVKNPMNYQQGYPRSVSSFILDTPGPTTPQLTQLALPLAGHPLFPLDTDFEPSFKVVIKDR